MTAGTAVDCWAATLTVTTAGPACWVGGDGGSTGGVAVGRVGTVVVETAELEDSAEEWEVLVIGGVRLWGRRGRPCR